MVELVFLLPRVSRILSVVLSSNILTDPKHKVQMPNNKKPENNCVTASALISLLQFLLVCRLQQLSANSLTCYTVEHRKDDRRYGFIKQTHLGMGCHSISSQNPDIAWMRGVGWGV